MKLLCPACCRDFEIDERNLDTDLVRCPRCSGVLPVLTQEEGRRTPFARQFRRSKAPRNRALWPIR